MLSSTMATRRRGSPAGWQAASPVTFAQRSPPASSKSTVTCQPAPLCWSKRASAPLTSSPVRVGVSSRRRRPSSSGRTRSPFSPSAASASAPVPSAVPSTGWTVSCAVRPSTSAACWGSWTPGSSTTTRLSPERTMVGSATPSASIRPRSTSTVRSVASRSASVVLVDLVSSTIWVPPRRSSPRRTGMVRAMVTAAAITRRATSARPLRECARERGRERFNTDLRQARRGGGRARPRREKEGEGDVTGVRCRRRRAARARGRGWCGRGRRVRRRTARWSAGG